MKLLSRFYLLLVLLLLIFSPVSAEEYSFNMKSPSTLEVGQTVNYNQLFTMTDGEVSDIYFDKDTIESNPVDVIAYDNDNKTITALKEGHSSACIHVDFTHISTGKPSFQKAFFEFNVIPVDQNLDVSLKENDIKMQIQESKTYQLNPEFNPNFIDLKWEITNVNIPDNFATISPEGIITANKTGSGKVDFTIIVNYNQKTIQKNFSINLTITDNAGDLFVVNPSEINEPFVKNKSLTVSVTVPEKYQDIIPTWTSDNPNIANVYGSKTAATISIRGVGSTVIHARYNDVDLKININITFDGQSYQTITDDKIRDLYNKYLAQYSKMNDNPLSISRAGILNENSNITDYGREVSLNVLNFYREMSGSTVVDPWDIELIQQAQAGVDFLANNNLTIDHNAADGSGDTLAQKGLNSSNLYSASDPIQSLLAYFNDINNMTSFNTGHRSWMIHPKIQKMGIASSRNSSALNVLGGTRSNITSQVVCYPAPGESPIELITINSGGIPLWTATLGDYYSAPDGIKNLQLNIKDNTGKSIDYTYSDNPTKESAWFNAEWSGNGIQFNPYPLVDGNYQNCLNKTYTITIKGLNGVSDTLQYTTHIGKLSNILRGLPSDAVEIYRLFNNTSGEHLYTSDVNEYNTLPWYGWTQEGTGWISPSNGDPVYRLYSPVTGSHLYTKDENEVETLLGNGAWTADNNHQPLFYSNGSKSVYRLYNEKQKMHLLTTDVNEYNVLAGSGWTQEGIALNALD